MARLSVTCLRFVMFGLACAMLIGETACAQNDAPTGQQAKRDAYDAALKCFVTNGNAERERLNAGDKAGAARYDATAKLAFDGAVKLGGMLSLTNRQMNHDLDAAQATELPKMIKDRDYFIDAVATCKGLGLM